MNGGQPQQQAQEPKPDDFDVWEFVTCAKCQLAFSQDGVSGPSVPFWITECGHVLCNTHLNPDRSCPSCKEQGVELMPLQKEMPSPFSEWFSPLPFKLDALAQAAKFQHERMAGAARFWKRRCAEYQSVLKRCKEDLANTKALKSELKMLRAENARLRGEPELPMHQYAQMIDTGSEPSHQLNMNRKRPMEGVEMSMSSPRVTATPLAPQRITRQPNHDAPPSLARLNGSDTSSGSRSGGRRALPGQPPGSSHFKQQYTYNSGLPPANGSMRQHEVLSHAQQAPARQRMQMDSRPQMPPPPTPQHTRQNISQQFQSQRVATPAFQQRQQMGLRNLPASANGSHPSPAWPQRTAEAQSLGQAPKRFVPPNFAASSNGPGPGFSVPPTPSGTSRRFVPSTPSHAGGRAYNASGFG